MTPQFLNHNSTSLPLSPLSLLTPPETSELWYVYEQLLVSCLQCGDDKSANMCLERLAGRFDSSNERVMGLKGMYDEAVAEDSRDLETILQNYRNTLSQRPTNGAIAKRQTALLTHLGRYEEAIKVLNEIINLSPTDIEAWAELSELYFKMSLYPQAVFCLEESLLIAPNAWNFFGPQLHARLGEIHYISSSLRIPDGNLDSDRMLVQALRRFSRSVELCDGYIRGWCGASSKLIVKFSNDVRALEEISGVSRDTVTGLNTKACTKLVKILAKYEDDCGQEDVVAARHVLKKTA
ncbi:MAG: hypothetical protein LQ340_000068 [Diploschistes diacapsis]|nr:MAG: hypothetical protein LQ340_000068 [Diploschistes diacapsis]